MNRRRWIWFISIPALIALILLASGLHNLHFKSGRSLPSILPSVIQLPADLPQTGEPIPLWKILFLWGTFLVTTLLILLLLSPEFRKRLLKQLLRFAATAVTVYLVLRIYFQRLANLATNSSRPADSGQAPASVGELFPIFQPPQMPPWMVFLASLGVLIVLFLVGWVGYRWWNRAYGRRSSGTLKEIAAIARSSIREIHSGRDWGDVIIQSYIRMGQAVSRTRGLERAEGMTPREFAERLQMNGLPAEAILRLTRLFESARYGRLPSSQKEIDEALACLNSILSACGVMQ